MVFLPHANPESYNSTPLWTAAWDGHEGVVRLLLQVGAAVDEAEDGGRTPLWIAAQNGQEAVVRLLLQAGAAVDEAEDSGATPLCIAAAYGQEVVVRLLLAAGADPASGRGGDREACRRALLHAPPSCSRQQPSCVRVLRSFVGGGF